MTEYLKPFNDQEEERGMKTTKSMYSSKAIPLCYGR